MSIRLTMFVLAFAFSATHATTTIASESHTSSRSTVTQFGITWTFDRDHTVGQFANGDWWVVGPVNIAKIDPPSLRQSNGRVVNGSMLNPQVGQNYGFDSTSNDRHSGNRYRSELNVAQGVGGGSPLKLSPGSSLLSSISWSDNDMPSRFRPVKSVSILTVVDEVPPADAFRPPYVDVSDKSVKHRYSQVRTELLPNFPIVSSQDDSWWGAGRSHIDFAPRWDRDHAVPTDNNPNYGRDIMDIFDRATGMLISDYPLEDKEDTLIRLIQAGIDLYGIAQRALESNAGQIWVGAGAHNNGRKWPIIFAGAMLADDDLLNVMQLIPEDERDMWFHEDSEVFTVTQRHVDATNGSDWNPPYSDRPQQPYSRQMIGMPEWSSDEQSRASRENARWNTHPYRQRGNMNVFHAQALAILAMGLQDAWGKDVRFDYMTRYVAIMEGAPDPWGEKLGYGSVAGVSSEYEGWLQYWHSKWRYDMWKAYWFDFYGQANGRPATVSPPSAPNLSVD